VKLQAVFPTILLIAATWACGGGGSARANNSPSGEALWEKVGLPSTATHLNHIAFNSTGHWFIADRSQGFFRSTDQGASWARINTGLATLSGGRLTLIPSKATLWQLPIRASTEPILLGSTAQQMRDPTGQRFRQVLALVLTRLSPGACLPPTGMLYAEVFGRPHPTAAPGFLRMVGRPRSPR
jgi:hypothetical protein